MLCNKCGKEVKENAKFCENCGSAIEYNEIKKENFDSNNLETHKENNSVTYLNNNTQISNNEDNGFGSVSLLLGIIGIVMVFINSIIALIMFILGIILGAIYKSKTKKKCFGLTLNIIALVLSIVFTFAGTLIMMNTMKDARNQLNQQMQDSDKQYECYSNNGYWENGKCLGSNKEDNNNTKTKDDTVIGVWSCKDDSLKEKVILKQYDENMDTTDYKIAFLLMENGKMMITYSSSEWRKGTYTYDYVKTDNGLKIYNLNIVANEIYSNGNHSINNSIEMNYSMAFHPTYEMAGILAKDGSTKYSCYKD